MTRDPALQISLFDSADSTALVTVNRSGAKLTPAQRKFNRLIDQIRQVRERLQMWESYRGRYQQRAATELDPAIASFRDVQRHLVLRLDRLLSEPGPGLGRRQRETLVYQLAGLLDEILRAGPDAELESLQAKYVATDEDETGIGEVEFGEAMITSLFGADALKGHKAKNLDELLDHAGARLSGSVDAREQEGGGRDSTRRGRPSHAEREAQRKARAAQDATASVRAIFRKLVSALHPDRESDVVERDRKTALMQRVNEAYDRGDLLALLTLQIEIEQIDAEHLATLPEVRLKHYNHVLEEQLELLRQQVQTIQFDFELMLGARFPLHEPRLVDLALTETVRDLQAMQHTIENDLRRFDDPRERRALIRDLVRRGDHYDEAGDDAMLDAFLAMAASSPPSRTGRKRPRSKP